MQFFLNGEKSLFMLEMHSRHISIAFIRWKQPYSISSYEMNLRVIVFGDSLIFQVEAIWDERRERACSLTNWLRRKGYYRNALSFTNWLRYQLFSTLDVREKWSGLSTQFRSLEIAWNKTLKQKVWCWYGMWH